MRVEFSKQQLQIIGEMVLKRVATAEDFEYTDRRYDDGKEWIVFAPRADVQICLIRNRSLQIKVGDVEGFYGTWPIIRNFDKILGLFKQSFKLARRKADIKHEIARRKQQEINAQRANVEISKHFPETGDYFLKQNNE